MPRYLAALTALLVGLSAPCAAALLPAPGGCAMAGCGDGPSVAAPRPACCCAQDTARSDGTPTITLMAKVFASGDHHSLGGAPEADLPGDGLDEPAASPPSPVPLYLLHSALLN